MRYVCDASGGKTWFRIESEAEAVAESETMRHAVEKYFRKEHDKAALAAAHISAALVSDPALAADATLLWIGRRVVFAPAEPAK